MLVMHSHLVQGIQNLIVVIHAIKVRAQVVDSVLSNCLSIIHQ